MSSSNTDSIRATFDDGVLRVEVPRAERPQPRRIQVQPGQRADQAQPAGDGQAGDQAQASGQAETSDQERKESSETSGSQTVGSEASRS
jgi:Hsp20/alpha crystallin family protein